MREREQLDLRAELEAKYARLLDADLGKWSKRNIEAFTSQLAARHATAMDARAAWHAWRARDMQPEEMRLGHDEHRYAEDRNIAYAGVLDALLRKETGRGILDRTAGPASEQDKRAVEAALLADGEAFTAAMRRDRRNFEEVTRQLPALDAAALRTDRTGESHPLERAYEEARRIERLIENRDSLVWLTHGLERDELMLQLRGKTDPRELAAFIKEHPLVEANFRRTRRTDEWVERPAVVKKLEDWDPLWESLILRTDDRVPPLTRALADAQRNREVAEDDFQPHARGMGETDA